VSSHKASQRPDGWEAVALDELISFVIGGDWGKAPNYEHEDYTEVFCIRGTEIKRWRQEKGATAALRRIKKASLEKRMLNEGDIILEVSGGGPEQPVGRVELVDAQALAQNSDTPKICTNFFRRMVPTEGINAPYLVHYLKYFYATGDIKNYQAGSNNLRNLKFNEYKRLRVPLPPLNEQHRIVEKIETLFAQIDKGEEALREVQKLLKRYRQSILKAAVTGELTRDWREANQHKLEPASDLLARILEARRENWQGRGQYKELTTSDSAELPELPEGWVWSTMDQLGEVLGGLTKNKKRLELPTKRPMLRVANVYQNRLNLEEIHEIGVSEKELERVSLESSDILIVEGNGSKDQIGRMAIWRNEIPDAVHQNHLIKARLFEKQLADYILAWFQSPIGRQVVELVASSTSGLYTLSLSKIKQLAVPLPSLPEAQRIVAEVRDLFSHADQLEAYCDAELRRSTALRQSILKSAFTGQLVPQDPNDEPASELLARIRADA